VTKAVSVETAFFYVPGFKRKNLIKFKLYLTILIYDLVLFRKGEILGIEIYETFTDDLSGVRGAAEG
jgi:hypothetical protein